MSRSAKKNRVGFRQLWMTMILVYGVIKETTTAPSGPTECEQPETISDQCCGTRRIDPLRKQCCSPGNHEDWNLGLESKDPKLAIKEYEDCCGGEVIGKGTGCCGNVKMDNATHMCCGGEPTERTRKHADDDQCCVSIDEQTRTTFNYKTHFCYHGDAIEIQKGKVRCEDNQYFISEQICCFGTLKDKYGPNGAEMECCGSYSVRSYDPETESCCLGHVHQGPHMCIDGRAIPCIALCGGVCYDKETQTCCHGRHVHPLGHQCKPACQTINLSKLERRPRSLCDYDMAIVARTKATSRGTTLRFDSHAPLWISTGHRGHQAPAKLKIKSCQFPQQPEHRVCLLQHKKNGKFRAKLVLGDFDKIEAFIERQSASACEQGRTLRHGDERRTI